MKLKFSGQFFKNTRISNFMKIRPVGAELFHADGRTDTMKLIVAFHNFAYSPKKRGWHTLILSVRTWSSSQTFANRRPMYVFVTCGSWHCVAVESPVVVMPAMFFRTAHWTQWVSITKPLRRSCFHFETHSTKRGIFTNIMFCHEKSFPIMITISLRKGDNTMLCCSCFCLKNNMFYLTSSKRLLVPKFAGSNPAKAVGFFRTKKS